LEAAEREGRFEAEGWRVRKDGSRLWANVVIDPIRDPSGKLVGYAKITRDLTERRAAEEELRVLWPNGCRVFQRLGIPRPIKTHVPESATTRPRASRGG
jgi:hypothetical protein